MIGELTIVYGGQFGSEGKGEVAYMLAEKNKPDFSVRVGGPNAGHTYHPRGDKALKGVVQTVPVACHAGLSTGVIGAGGAFIVDILKEELKQAYSRNGEAPVLYIDSNAAIITKAHQATEAHLKGSIGSTGEGVGAATAAKVMREPTMVAKNNTDLLTNEIFSHAYGSRVMIIDTVEMLNEALRGGADIHIEGTQGIGLSLHTSGFYPKCTSREVTPMGLLADSGINPANANWIHQVMVIRTYPIRVAGNSGPLENETTWETLAELSNEYIVPEITTVTKKVRRVGKLDPDQIRRSMLLTSPTEVVLTFFDYEFPELAMITNPGDLQAYHIKYLQELEETFGMDLSYVGTGPGALLPVTGVLMPF